MTLNRSEALRRSRIALGILEAFFATPFILATAWVIVHEFRYPGSTAWGLWFLILAPEIVLVLGSIGAFANLRGLIWIQFIINGLALLCCMLLLTKGNQYDFFGAFSPVGLMIFVAGVLEAISIPVLFLETASASREQRDSASGRVTNP